MQSFKNIQYLKNSEIDKSRWDDCIAQATNSLIYAHTFYLDNMCAGWDGFVGENYEWVLPLTYNRKWGFTYLYQPPFTQQLGIFAKQNVSVPVNEIINLLKEKYTFWEVNWNYNLKADFLSKDVTIDTGTNLVLNLQPTYATLADNYHKDLIKNLKRSRKFELLYRSSLDYKNLIELYRLLYAQRIPHVLDGDYKNFAGLCSYAQQHDMLICREVIGQHDELISAVLLLSDGKKLYNLINSTTEAGRKTEANHFLMDAVIKEFSEQNLVLDFEGSDLPGVKTFYENFGGINQPYYRVKYNNLPWPAKMFKK